MKKTSMLCMLIAVMAIVVGMPRNGYALSMDDIPIIGDVWDVLGDTVDKLTPQIKEFRVPDGKIFVRSNMMLPSTQKDVVSVVEGSESFCWAEIQVKNKNPEWTFYYDVKSFGTATPFGTWESARASNKSVFSGMIQGKSLSTPEKRIDTATANSAVVLHLQVKPGKTGEGIPELVTVNIVSKRSLAEAIMAGQNQGVAVRRQVQQPADQQTTFQKAGQLWIFGPTGREMPVQLRYELQGFKTQVQTVVLATNGLQKVEGISLPTDGRPIQITGTLNGVERSVELSLTAPTQTLNFRGGE